MRKMIVRILAVILATVATYTIVVALLFLNYNWTAFVQFVKNFQLEAAITLIVPALIAGGVGHALWAKGKKNKKS